MEKDKGTEEDNIIVNESSHIIYIGCSSKSPSNWIAEIVLRGQTVKCQESGVNEIIKLKK